MCLMEKRLSEIFRESTIDSPTSIIDEIVIGARSTQKIAYWHPLGFIVIPLGSFPDASYRLHISSPNFRKPQSPLWRAHDHSYNFESIVLKGSVCNKIFDIRTANLEDSTNAHRIYDVQYSSGISTLNRSDSIVVAVEAAKFSILAGNKYSISAGVFHENSHGAGLFAASLVRTSPLNGRSPRVLGDIDGEFSYSYAREPVLDQDLQLLYGELSS